MSYENIKESCLRDFAKSVDYWFLEEIDLKIKNSNVVNFAGRLSTIVGYQTMKPLNRDDKACPWSIAMCKRLFMELPCPVAKEVTKTWRTKNGMKLFETAKLAETESDKYSPVTQLPNKNNFNHPMNRINV
jgi:hypothetical protein